MVSTNSGHYFSFVYRMSEKHHIISNKEYTRGTLRSAGYIFVNVSLVSEPKPPACGELVFWDMYWTWCTACWTYLVVSYVELIFGHSALYIWSFYCNYFTRHEFRTSVTSPEKSQLTNNERKPLVMSLLSLSLPVYFHNPETSLFNPIKRVFEKFAVNSLFINLL